MQGDTHALMRNKCVEFDSQPGGFLAIKIKAKIDSCINICARLLEMRVGKNVLTGC